ncbi:uncharacterized protein TNCV_2032861 [Trichonephila clavipes]|nr:uncharacterized protein TNCV_2032861 [Trichonephila clavipes]
MPEVIHVQFTMADRCVLTTWLPLEVRFILWYEWTYGPSVFAIHVCLEKKDRMGTMKVLSGCPSTPTKENTIASCTPIFASQDTDSYHSGFFELIALPDKCLNVGGDTLRYNSGVRVRVILLENSSLNAVHEWQFYRLNCQTDVQIRNHCVCDNHESALATVIGNCSPDHDFRCRCSVSRLQTVWLQVFPWLPSDQHTAITGTKAEPAFIRKHNRSLLRLPVSSGLTSLARERKWLGVSRIQAIGLLFWSCP